MSVARRSTSNPTKFTGVQLNSNNKSPRRRKSTKMKLTFTSASWNLKSRTAKQQDVETVGV
eukprot:3258242-Alexandrium_andersonii.AAC.1